MVWSFMGNTRMYQALRDYGDRLDTVGIFTFEVDATGTISETGTSISTMLTYINKWPHIKWMLTVMNHGTASIFTALRNNTDGAKDMFLTELVRIMEKYPWCAGVDIDLERGGEIENRDAANALFRDIYNAVKAYDSSKLVNICLPGMTSVNGSVGGENWCVYADLDAYCDTAAIMSYGKALLPARCRLVTGWRASTIMLPLSWTRRRSSSACPVTAGTGRFTIHQKTSVKPIVALPTPTMLQSYG